MGGSDKPSSGYEKKAMARDIYALARHLGYEQINITGHGIGSMVAFSYAANYPQATEKLAMLNTAHIDESYYEFRIMPRPSNPGPTAGGLVSTWFRIFQNRSSPADTGIWSITCSASAC
jgi:pimeloyl-ACP methyl ester carboxylesterase